MARYTKQDADNARNDLALFLSGLYRNGDISTGTVTQALHALSVLEDRAGAGEKALELFNHGATSENYIRKTWR